MELNPSAIAVHPKTEEQYILSASGRLLVVLDGKNLKGVFPLPQSIYHKPEGLAFSEKGDLFLSSEGMKKGYLNGQIFMFESR